MLSGASSSVPDRGSPGPARWGLTRFAWDIRLSNSRPSGAGCLAVRGSIPTATDRVCLVAGATDPSVYNRIPVGKRVNAFLIFAPFVRLLARWPYLASYQYVRRARDLRARPVRVRLEAIPQVTLEVPCPLLRDPAPGPRGLGPAPAAPRHQPGVPRPGPRADAGRPTVRVPGAARETPVPGHRG